jgi:hypothetical protein
VQPKAHEADWTHALALLEEIELALYSGLSQATEIHDLDDRNRSRSYIGAKITRAFSDCHEHQLKTAGVNHRPRSRPATSDAGTAMSTATRGS